MNFIRSLVCFAALAYAVYAVTEELSDQVVASYADAYEKYVIKFNKAYSTKEEYDKHLRAYAKSMEEVKILNSENHGAVFGETSRSDLLEEERALFAERIRVPPISKRVTDKYPQPKVAVKLGHTANNVPTSFNWFNVSGVKHPARNQGQCGSCWAFSAVGGLEMQSVLEGHNYIKLSTEQAVDCSSSSVTNGCCGGWPGDFYDDVKKFATEQSYPYQLSGGSSTCKPYSCRTNGKVIVTTQINGYDCWTALSAEELKKQIWMYGPISIWLSAPYALSSYHSGVLDCTNLKKEGGHYVVAVGFGANHITLRNSWGADWGLEGDFMLSTKSKEASCDMLGPSQYIQVARVSVKP